MENPSLVFTVCVAESRIYISDLNGAEWGEGGQQEGAVGRLMRRRTSTLFSSPP